MNIRMYGDMDSFKRSFDFANKVYDTNFNMYTNRNTSLYPEKVRKDIVVGKYCEFIISKYYGERCTLPDVEVYGMWNKTYDPDLVLDGDMNLHVKSCIGDGYYPDSWIFQKNDPLVLSPEQNDFLFCCLVSKDGQAIDVEIIDAITAQTLYANPKKTILIKNKVALYLHDILRYKEKHKYYENIFYNTFEK